MNKLIRLWISSMPTAATYAPAAASGTDSACTIVCSTWPSSSNNAIVHALSVPLAAAGAYAAAVGMLLIQSLINLFIPSGSGQAYVTMPLMAPISDLVGVTRQTAVLAYQFGDGMMNMIVPTNPVLMGILGIAGIPYDRWFRFIAPLMVKLILAASVVMVFAVWIDYR